jgi:hypothetical protein
MEETDECGRPRVVQIGMKFGPICFLNNTNITVQIYFKFGFTQLAKIKFIS